MLKVNEEKNSAVSSSGFVNTATLDAEPTLDDERDIAVRRSAHRAISQRGSGACVQIYAQALLNLLDERAALRTALELAERKQLTP